jgi:hypothetical protein
VRWPGKIKAGAVVDTPVISTDWVPTLLALTGTGSKERFDGVSLEGVLTKGEELPARPLFWHLPHYTNQGSRPSGAVRDGDWKLIEHYEDGSCELFNLATDPGEKNDLSAQEPARVAELRGKLEAWRRDVGAQENTANPDFNGSLWQRLYHDVDPSKLTAAEKAAIAGKELTPWRNLMNQVLPRRDAKYAAGIEPGSGMIILHARDAKVHGDKLRYEPEPKKDTLGLWTQKDDWVEWTFDAPHAGKFVVEVLQGCDRDNGGAEVELTIGDQKLAMKVEETGHFQRFVPRVLGMIKLEKPGKYTATVKAQSKPRNAVMDLRRIVLRSAP